MNDLINQIEELYFLGGDLQEILKVAIEDTVSKKKIIRIPWTIREIQIVKDMKEQGYMDKEIAWELGRERSHVSQKIYNMKIREKAQ